MENGGSMRQMEIQTIYSRRLAVNSGENALLQMAGNHFAKTMVIPSFEFSDLKICDLVRKSPRRRGSQRTVYI